jgi:transposase
VDRERFILSDTVWEKIEALLPGKKSDRGVTAKDNRLFLEAVLWRVRAGLPWRDLPAEFGNWNTVFKRFRRWDGGGFLTASSMPCPQNRISNMR